LFVSWFVNLWGYRKSFHFYILPCSFVSQPEQAEAGMGI